jgi:hypothetical protein
MRQLEASEPIAWLLRHPAHGETLSQHPITEGDRSLGWVGAPLYASPPAGIRQSVGVRVKPLEWHTLTRLSDKDTWRSDSIVGRYTVIDAMGWGPEPANEVWHCADDEAAKARCQADYESRIRAVLADGGQS